MNASAEPGRAGAFSPTEGEEIARAIAGDLARLYGPRLRRVVLFGSWARGEAGEDSDVDLLVVLDRVDDQSEEWWRVADIAAEHSYRALRAVTAIPVGEDETIQPGESFIRKALAEGRDVA